jgi:hypothetical protein
MEKIKLVQFPVYVSVVACMRDYRRWIDIRIY